MQSPRTFPGFLGSTFLQQVLLVQTPEQPFLPRRSWNLGIRRRSRTHPLRLLVSLLRPQSPAFLLCLEPFDGFSTGLQLLSLFDDATGKSSKPQGASLEPKNCLQFLSAPLSEAASASPA